MTRNEARTAWNRALHNLDAARAEYNRAVAD